MVRIWILLVLVAVGIGSFSAHEYEYDEGLREDEYDDMQAYDDDVSSLETDYENGDAKTLDLKSDGLLIGETEKNKNANELENESNNDNFDDDKVADDTEVNGSEQNDKAVKEEIEQLRRDLEEPVDNIDEALLDDSINNKEHIEGDNGNKESVEKEIELFESNNDDDPIEDNRSLGKDPEEEPEQMLNQNELNNESNDNFDDYQVEDNRSDGVEAAKKKHDNDGQETDTLVEDEKNYGEFKISDDVFPLLIPPEIVEDVKNILDKTDSNFDGKDYLASAEFNNNGVDKNALKESNEAIAKETQGLEKTLEDQHDEIGQLNEEVPADHQILEGVSKENTDDKTLNHLDIIDQDETEDVKEPENPEDSNSKVHDEGKVIDEIHSDEDTVDKVYEDLHDDLKKLFDTWDKLNDDSSESENVQDYEEKYGRPFREDFVLSQRAEIDYYDEDIAKNIDSNLGDIFSDKSDSDSDKNIDKADDNLTDKLTVDEIKSQEKQIYDNDGLVADEFVKKSDEAVTPEQITSFPTIGVEELSPEQYNDLMAQFVASHKEELDTKRDDFGRNIAPVHLNLSPDEILEVTSPNYPSPFPTNNVVDWILEGEGMGIELNITDFAVRGAQGDYLLIKPGGLDASGSEGLVFSFTLNEPRLYRFTNVDRMFVRFVSGAGWGLLRGFRMGVKMIWPPNAFDEEVPEPEALLPPLPGTFTVNLGGLSVEKFLAIEDEFRRIVADMAIMYIHAYNIDMGVNTTSETARIATVTYCNINWPNFEECVEVTFGVPLVYDDGAVTRLHDNDLKVMWETYVSEDPFATRLRLMGVKEFAVPADERILTAWLVLASGVIISAALLALALWRYSCFDNYTRMKSFSDTDSIRDEKKGLDLYPTPHQTLPSLYAENDYKWADSNYDDTARVDLGGIPNSGYMRDELLDIDSDEDVITTRDGSAGFSARDMYQV